MHSVQWCAANACSDSPSGMGVRPSMRVKITVWVTSGSVKLSTAAAAEAIADDTPGTTAIGIPAASKGCTNSMSAPYKPGSPVCNRTTVSQRWACAISHADMASNVMSLLSAITQSGAAQRVAAALTKEPANKIAPARSISARPFTVINSGSPGPAPTNHTVPLFIKCTLLKTHAIGQSQRQWFCRMKCTVFYRSRFVGQTGGVVILNVIHCAVEQVEDF